MQPEMDKIYKTMKDSEPVRWETNEVSPMTAPIYCFGRGFQAVVQRGGTQAETGRLPKMKRQS